MLSAFTRRILKVRLQFEVLHFSTVNVNINNKQSVDAGDHINIVYSCLPDIKFCDLTLSEYVMQNFEKFPKRIGVECAITGKKYTYEELRRKTTNFANALHKKLKLRKGDVVAIILPNIPDFPICILGALEAALTVTTVNPLYTPDEIQRQLVDSNAKLIITFGQLWPTIQATVKLLPNSRIPKIVTIKMTESETLPQGSINFQELADTSCDTHILEKLDVDDIAVLPYSSGTTGLPKGVELTSRNIVSNLQQMDEPSIRFGDTTTDLHQDVIPAIVPWFHIYGMVAVLFNNLQLLSKIVSLPKFSPEVYVDMLDKHKPHILFIVPPIVLLMNNSPLVQKKHLQSIHTICSGAAPLGALDEEKLQKKADKEISILQGYGLTESCSCIFVLPKHTKKKLGVTGSVGAPVSSTLVKVVSPSGEALGPNSYGELLAKGPQITSRYYNNLQESTEAFKDGWFCTGDVAYYDDNKLFYIADRLKELIKVKGYQVAPAELEEIIRDYPGVTDVAVTGVPHEVYGEVPRAYIVTKPNVVVKEDKIQEYVASKVSTFKQLKGGVIFIKNIPKTASGKIVRKELKLMHNN